MKKEEVLARLKEIITDRLDVEEDQIVPEATFVEDLGADSLDIVELSMALEEEFEIGEMGDEDLSSIKNIQDLVNLIQSRLDD